MFDKDSLHHAYFIEGIRTDVLADIDAFLEKALAITRKAHTDVHYSEYESFGIDEGRQLSGMQSMMPVMGDKKIFILATDSITSEAQNALLKVFEEPTAGTHFFIISSSKRILLPTLASRLQIISHISAAPSTSPNDAKSFMGMSPKDRIAFVVKMIEDKDKSQAENFLLDIIAELQKDLKKKPQQGKVIKELLSFAKYLKDRSSSLKLILERVALLDF